MHSGHRADEVGMGHVRQRRQMGLMVIMLLLCCHPILTSPFTSHLSITDPPPRPNPLPRPLLLRPPVPPLKNPTPHTLKRRRPILTPDRRIRQGAPPPLPLRRHLHIRRHTTLMLHPHLPTTPLPHKTNRSRKDTPPPLPRLHRPRHEAPPIPHPLHLIHHGYLRVAGQHEVAVHGVHDEGGWDGGLGGGEGLCDRGAAVDAAGAGGMPEWVGVRVGGGRDVG